MRLSLICVIGLIAALQSATHLNAQALGGDFFRQSISPDSFLDSNLTETTLVTSFRPSFDWESRADFDSIYGLEMEFPDPINEPGLIENVTGNLVDFGSNVVGDHRSFYSASNLKFLGGMFLVGGAIANSPLDDSIRKGLRDNLVYTPSDEYAEFFHEHSFLGDGFVLLPAYAAISITGKYLIDDPRAFVVGDWSERTIRGILVGAPPLLFTQLATGGSRPNEQGYRSDWRPFQDDNGVSGHAFMGAVPFLTAARMSKNPWWKGTFIAASLVPGVSRITDDAHYPSQVFLGWTLAWVATSAVNTTQIAHHNISIEPTVIDGSAGLGFSIRR